MKISIHNKIFMTASYNLKTHTKVDPGIFFNQTLQQYSFFTSFSLTGKQGIMEWATTTAAEALLLQPPTTISIACCSTNNV